MALTPEQKACYSEYLQRKLNELNISGNDHQAIHNWIADNREDLVNDQLMHDYCMAAQAAEKTARQAAMKSELESDGYTVTLPS
jgi:hypothetical protein